MHTKTLIGAEKLLARFGAHGFRTFVNADVDDLFEVPDADKLYANVSIGHHANAFWFSVGSGDTGDDPESEQAHNLIMRLVRDEATRAGLEIIEVDLLAEGPSVDILLASPEDAREISRKQAKAMADKIVG